MLSIRLKPELEVLLAARARQAGVSKSRLVQDLLARELQASGLTPYELLLELNDGTEGSGNADNSRDVSGRLKDKLRAKHHRR